MLILKQSKLEQLSNNFFFLAFGVFLIGFSTTYLLFLFIFLIYLFFLFKKLHFYKYSLIIFFVFTIVFVLNKLYKSQLNGDSFTATVESVKDGKVIVSTGLFKEDVLLYTKESLSVGDKVKISGELREPESKSFMGDFDYKEYLYSKNIYYIMKYPT